MENISKTQSRKWLLTINNPADKNLNHEEIRNLIDSLKSTIYFCMSDEIGEEKTPHTHVFIAFSAPVRFSTLKNLFPTAHIDKAMGTAQENRDYILKTGKWLHSEKKETSVLGSFEEWGDFPEIKRGARKDLSMLYEMVKNGASNYEIFEANQSNIRYINFIDRVRQTLVYEDTKNSYRQLKVTYIWGVTGSGKTRHVMEKHGYENVFRVTDYKHPFDNYNGEKIILFDEFSSNFSIREMLNYLDGYPLELPCRYANKWANYETVYIISNLPLSKQYEFERENDIQTYGAFRRRIHDVIEFRENGERISLNPLSIE